MSFHTDAKRYLKNIDIVDNYFKNLDTKPLTKFDINAIFSALYLLVDYIRVKHNKHYNEILKSFSKQYVELLDKRNKTTLEKSRMLISILAKIYFEIRDNLIRFAKDIKKDIDGGSFNTDMINFETSLTKDLSSYTADELFDLSKDAPELLPIGLLAKGINDYGVGVIDKIFGISSHQFPEARFVQAYGQNYENIVNRFGFNSEQAQTFEEYYPSQLTESYYLYNNQADPNSGYLDGYDKNYQDFYIEVSRLQPAEQNATAIIPIAKKYGLTWSSPTDSNVQKTGNFGRIHGTFSNRIYPLIVQSRINDKTQVVKPNSLFFKAFNIPEPAGIVQAG